MTSVDSNSGVAAQHWHNLAGPFEDANAASSQGEYASTMKKFCKRSRWRVTAFDVTSMTAISLRLHGFRSLREATQTPLSEHHLDFQQPD
jgi:hypothetical protein